MATFIHITDERVAHRILCGGIRAAVFTATHQQMEAPLFNELLFGRRRPTYVALDQLPRLYADPPRRRAADRCRIDRFGVKETSIFEEVKRQEKIVKSPVLEVLRKNWREVLLTCLIRTGQQAPFFLFTTFLVSYGTGTLHMSRDFLFNAVLAASARRCLATSRIISVASAYI